MPAKKEVSTTKPAEAKTTISKKFSGVVVSDKNDKTIIVKVETVKVHPKYKKRHVVSRRYKVHDETNQYKTGDKVIFIECRPLSRDKRWRVLIQ
jgi:small subunit ribosomal protein S17